MRKLLLLLFTLIPAVVWAQRYDLSGRVLVKGTDKPIAQAVVELPQAGLWAVADGDGNFTVKGVPKGATRFVVSCLGYATTETELDVRAGMGRIVLYAPEDNLKLESVVVTAKEAPNAMATSRTIGGNAIDHLQMVNASDISSLLPGGKTINPDLTKTMSFAAQRRFRGRKRLVRHGRRGGRRAHLDQRFAGAKCRARAPATSLRRISSRSRW